MAKYIELEVAVKAFNNFDAGRADSPPCTLLTPEEFAEYLYELPTADVAPVVHGRWEWADDGYCRCSECRQRAPVVYGALIEDYQDEPQTVMTYFCPHCGAMMDGGDSDVAD